MIEITNILINKKFDLNTGHRSAVQKGNMGKTYAYALQLRNNQQDTFVLRGKAGNVSTKILELVNSAAGHTQTWEYSGNKDKWFIGTEPSSTANGHWAKQIARVDIKTQSGTHGYNTDFPRLGYLNRAGSGLKVDGTRYNGTDMKRSEAAVSPNHTKFLLATVDNAGNGYFTIYDLNTINAALNRSSTDPVNIGNFSYIESFSTKNLITTTKQKGLINSIQGYDLDDNSNIYISSQKKPDFNNGIYQAHHKQIIKIPYYARSDQSKWLSINLSSFGGLDISGKHSEVEGIQVIGEDHIWLTVAYHANVGGKNKTVANKMYELTWS
ncbi:helveticin J family class III bacteriocin [Lactobacillus sp. ESL0791]|uniref:helveticin J family class III bacteriocin n=1 Tax=Lactobacillus sp. ESL0791 TaxID=2983234 RepID=UPI0023F7AB87|nr:helveticin J family class III bacteriocin [Lactobacillus sp. ESL0791]MDF7639972.1 helveticin J family class III bacteriocin [Lactobacillus sp. ESL0791]